MTGAPRHRELAALIELLRDRVDPDLQVAAGERFERFLDELDSIADDDLPPADPREDRWQDRIIAGAIPAGATVLDLGCGDGELLDRVIRGGARGQGIELDADQVARCIERGVPVHQADVDQGLKGYADASFDYVVLEETLQTLHRPVDVLAEMLRVGRVGIVSFPNFGFWRLRLDLAIRGRMPVSPRLPHRWFDTPNIHHLTLNDFLDWCASHRVAIEQAWALSDGAVRPLQDGDNLRAAEVLLFVRREDR